MDIGSHGCNKQANSRVITEERTLSQHQWLLYVATMGWFGITGVTNSSRIDDPEVSAFMEGIHGKSISQQTDIAQVSSSTTTLLSLIKNSIYLQQFMMCCHWQ
jgi:hypothetical protein